MKRLVVVFLTVVVLVSVAQAGRYAITTSASEDIALQALADKVNAQRLLQSPPLPPLTLDQVIVDQLKTSVRDWIARYRGELEQKFLDAVRKKDDPTAMTLKDKIQSLGP